ncbi:unnamed protein product [Closterium sp. Naga37s-1]|nr:unnamed protein product [Closterium sp. Naga37s-1]
MSPCVHALPPLLPHPLPSSPFPRPPLLSPPLLSPLTCPPPASSPPRHELVRLLRVSAALVLRLLQRALHLRACANRALAIPPAPPAAVTQQQVSARVSESAACWNREGVAGQGTKESDGSDATGMRDGKLMQVGGEEEEEVMRRERGGIMYGRERSRHGAVVVVVGGEEGQAGRGILQCEEVVMGVQRSEEEWRVRGSGSSRARGWGHVAGRGERVRLQQEKEGASNENGGLWEVGTGGGDESGEECGEEGESSDQQEVIQAGAYVYATASASTTLPLSTSVGSYIVCWNGEHGMEGNQQQQQQMDEEVAACSGGVDQSAVLEERREKERNFCGQQGLTAGGLVTGAGDGGGGGAGTVVGCQGAWVTPAAHAHAHAHADVVAVGDCVGVGDADDAGGSDSGVAGNTDEEQEGDRVADGEDGGDVEGLLELQVLDAAVDALIADADGVADSDAHRFFANPPHLSRRSNYMGVPCVSLVSPPPPALAAAAAAAAAAAVGAAGAAAHPHGFSLHAAAGRGVAAGIPAAWLPAPGGAVVSSLPTPILLPPLFATPFAPPFHPFPPDPTPLYGTLPSPPSSLSAQTQAACKGTAVAYSEPRYAGGLVEGENHGVPFMPCKQPSGACSVGNVGSVGSASAHGMKAHVMSSWLMDGAGTCFAAPTAESELWPGLADSASAATAAAAAAAAGAAAAADYGGDAGAAAVNAATAAVVSVQQRVSTDPHSVSSCDLCVAAAPCTACHFRPVLCYAVALSPCSVHHCLFPFICPPPRTHMSQFLPARISALTFLEHPPSVAASPLLCPPSPPTLPSFPTPVPCPPFPQSTPPTPQCPPVVAMARHASSTIPTWLDTIGPSSLPVCNAHIPISAAVAVAAAGYAQDVLPKPPQQQQRRQGEGEWEEWEEQLSEAWLLPAGPRLRLYHHQKHPERPGLPDCAQEFTTLAFSDTNAASHSLPSPPDLPLPTSPLPHFPTSPHPFPRPLLPTSPHCFLHRFWLDTPPHLHSLAKPQHYVRTGNCRFGNECRYNHPKLRVDASTACG